MRYNNPHPQQHGQQMHQQQMNPQQIAMQQIQQQLHAANQQLQQAYTNPQQNVMAIQQLQNFIAQLNQQAMALSMGHNAPHAQHPQMQQQMQQQQFMNQRFPNQPAQTHPGIQNAGLMNRFNDSTTPQGQTFGGADDRYGSGGSPVQATAPTNPVPVQEEEPVVKELDQYVVTENNVAFPHNTSVAVRIRKTEITPDVMDQHDSVIVCFDLTGAAQAVKEHFEENCGEGSKKYLYASKIAEVDDAVTVPSNQQYCDLFSSGIRDLYRWMKNHYKQIDKVHKGLLLDRLNDSLTEKVNSILVGCHGNLVSIDSFITDFNDLLKVLRNNFDDDAEDVLLDELDKYIADIRDAMEAHDACTEENEDKEVGVYKPYLMVYMSGWGYSTGIHEVKEWVVIPEHPSNVFLTSLVNLTTQTYDTSEFLLATRDEMVFQFQVGSEGKVLARRVR